MKTTLTRDIGIVLVAFFVLLGVLMGLTPPAAAQYQVYRPSTPTYTPDYALPNAIDRVRRGLRRRLEQRRLEDDQAACVSKRSVFESQACARHIDRLGRYEREAFIRYLPE